MAAKNLAVEQQRSRPDYIVYAPTRESTREQLDTHDNGNEHFLVFPSLSGDFLAVWTQSSYEGARDHRIVIARSTDRGQTWSEPLRIVGPTAPGAGPMASWGFPIQIPSGRIYVFWNQYQGIDDVAAAHTGTMDCCFSDDDGRTWSSPVTIPQTRSPRDHTDPGVPANWIVWQKPERDPQGRWLAGLTRWTSKAVRPPRVDNWWGGEDSRAEFVHFDNIDDGPDPADLRLTWHQATTAGLAAPYLGHPEVLVGQEPSWVPLPDGRIFSTMRTCSGAIWYSVSDDCGVSWREPEPLARRDGGDVLSQPLCCCPIYRLGDGRYLLIYHNNTGLDGAGNRIRDTSCRRPAFYAVGTFAPEAHQPIAFGPTRFLMDNDGVPLGPLGRHDLAVYTSYTEVAGERVLWYPERKFFLLGKRITDEMLTDVE